MNARDSQFHALYRKARITDQADYYGRRAEEYRRAHSQVVISRNVLLLIASIAGVLSQAVDGSARAGSAVGAAVLGSLAGAVTAYDSLIGFPQLRKLYIDAERNLEEAAIDWDEIGALMPREFDRVEQIFRSERGQWGQLIVKAATTDHSARTDGQSATTGTGNDPASADPFTRPD